VISEHKHDKGVRVSLFLLLNLEKLSGYSWFPTFLNVFVLVFLMQLLVNFGSYQLENQDAYITPNTIHLP
jgi:hypothetical protein